MGNGPASGNGQAPNQPATPVSGNDQASTTTQVNNTASPSSGPHGQTPTATPHQTSTSDFTPPSADEWKRVQQEMAEARRESARYRDELKKRDDANLSAEQKRERDYTDMQTRVLEQELRLQRLALENTGHRLNSKITMADVGAVLALVQAEHGHEITYEADGTPSNLEDLVKTVLKEHPALAGTPAGGAAATSGAPRSASSGGATNPGAGARVGAFTREQIARMSPAEYEANKSAILAALYRNELK